MKNLTLFLLYLLTSLTISAQKKTLYSKAYGKSTNPAIIFIHGGPRGNSTLFEGTTAEELAKKGFYVIVYDRRGEGRSINTTATFTFKEAFTDLNDLYKNTTSKKQTL